MTVHAAVFARVQMVQKVEETLNKFKRTRLVSRDMGRCREWKVRWVGGERDCYCSCRCVCKDSEGLER